ncbi:MAG: tryptophan synthase subunit alpha [Chloroflexota bacterium]|nr:tryptophan synthase subunit alpha [Chloroflexota bacterium]
MGWQALEKSLKRLEAGDPTRVVPFLTVGFPDIDATMSVVPALERAGAAALELGVPFSDPLAEGPTIQRSSEGALAQGVTLSSCIETAGALREKGVAMPMVLMGYYNPFLAYGLDRLVDDAASVGVDGFIVPDLPVEEHEPFLEACLRRELGLVPLLAPTSTDDRIDAACASAHGFIYCVSLLGVTGARDQPLPEAASLISRVRSRTDTPLAVGFGISRKAQVDALPDEVDAVVVGSALVDLVASSASEDREARVHEFLTGLGATSGQGPGQ